MTSSRIPGLYKLSVSERLDKIADYASLNESEKQAIKDGGITEEDADRMIENVVGCFKMPLAVSVNFLVNGRDYVVPMALEEPSVVAAASNMAKAVRESGGFSAESDESMMLGQVQVVGAKDAAKASKKILDSEKEILALANSKDPLLVKFGGGARKISVRIVGDMLVVHLHVDVKDAMGANAVNTMCEAVSPLLAKISEGRAVLRILSNYAVERLARASCTVKKDILGGEKIVDNIVLAQKFAENDVYRAVTHNKGVMNGIDAVLVATGNDWRAVEAAVHAHAAGGGVYRPVTRWVKNKDGDLEGSIEVPLAVGVVGGSTKTHQTARAALKVLGVKSAREFAQVLAAVGLAQNLAALRALADEGIQSGHMKLHMKKQGNQNA
jgi:hydroxymethylglutaryl-CoA reductase